MVDIAAAIIVLMFGHFIADFVCQTHWQATNKSSNNIALGQHVLTYSLMMLFVTASFLGYHLFFWWVGYVLINGSLHFLTDYCTSRLSKHYWNKGETHNFFVVIGADQLIHQVCLIGTYILMLHMMGR